MRKQCKRTVRKPVNPFLIAQQQATRLTPAEVAEQMAPARAAFTALREGVGTELHWMVIASCLNIALSIEKQGVVRGITGHLTAAEKALNGIEDRTRAGGPGTWCRTPLYWHEIDALDTFMTIHQYQFEQLSYREYKVACSQAVARVASTGGRVLNLAELPMEAL